MISDEEAAIAEQPVDLEPGEGGATPNDRRRPLSTLSRFLSRPLVLPIIALVLAVVLAALLVVNHRRSTEDAARAEAPRIVAEHVADLLSYTPATVSSDLAKKKKWLTGDFLDEYTVLVTKTIAPAAVQGGVTADATVVARGVQSASSDRVEMLMFVNVTTTRTSAQAPKSEGSRVRVVAVKVGRSWLISSLSPV